jgi:non-heme chloroperoxidase
MRSSRSIEAEVSSHTVVGDHGAELHVVEAGKGPVIVLVPGWTMSWTVFERQLPVLAQTHRVISFDPRSQRRSSTTAEGNSYSQHGHDLERVVDTLGVKRFSLVGWSWGGLDAYSYLGRAGSTRVDRLVVIDNSPCPLIDDPATGWGDFTAESFRRFGKSITEDRSAYASRFVESMLSAPLDVTDRSWLTEMHLATTTPIATTLAVSALQSDYTRTAQELDGQIPVLQVVRDEDFERAGAWLSTHMPNSRVAAIPSHIGFWEDAGGFNDVLGGFLTAA